MFPEYSFLSGDLSLFAHRLEVSAHYAYCILGPHLLELIARSSPVAGQVVDGANGIIAIVGGLESKMGAPFPGRLEDHGLLIIWIYAAVCQNRRRVDDKNIQVKAALSAAQAEHDAA